MAARIFKLITGEEIIAQLDSRTAEHVELKRVRVISRLPMGNPNTGAVQFVNILTNYYGGSPHTDNLKLEPWHIMQEAEPEADLERIYIKEHSGIELASAIPKGRG